MNVLFIYLFIYLLTYFEEITLEIFPKISNTSCNPHISFIVMTVLVFR
jgi:hypothetical protein